jgi:hypothetical protein
MVGFSTGGNNISTQFGMPLFGIMGTLPPFTGNYFWVDGTNGSDGNTGGPQDPFKTLSQAQTACLAGNNDVVFFTGTYSPTATFVWSKNNTHLIGQSLSPYAFPSISVASTAATSGAFSPLVSVTASNCIFMNFSVTSGIAQAATQVAWAEAGGNNTYIGVNLNQVGNATAAAQAGNRALTLASLNNYFQDCVIGGDAIVRATGTNYTVGLLAGSGSSIFRRCTFPMWSSVAASAHFTAAASTFSGYIILDDCMLINDVFNAGYTQLTQALSVSATAGGLVLLTATTISVGAALITSSGVSAYVSGPVPTATTSNLAVVSS